MELKKGLEASPSSRGQALRIEMLKELARTFVKEMEALGRGRTQAGPDSFNFYEEVEQLEIDMIRYALLHTDGNQRRAAMMLGLKATTLNSKIKRYGISSDETPVPAAQLKSARAMKSAGRDNLTQGG